MMSMLRQPRMPPSSRSSEFHHNTRATTSNNVTAVNVEIEFGRGRGRQ